jgi:hypothetical protein
MGTIEKAYTKNIVADICDEIERQWEHHLLIRAAFPAGIPDDRSQYKSPPYYRRKNVVFLVCRPQPLPAVMARGYDGVGAWANQNYVIRLFGILEEYGVIKAGKNAGNPYTEIVALLRNSVGAHSRGQKNPGRSETKRATRLIQEHLDDRVLPEMIKTFNLSIDSVLERLKDGCQQFVMSLEGSPVPSRKAV